MKSDLTTKNDNVLIDEIKKIKIELDELKNEKNILDYSLPKKIKPPKKKKIKSIKKIKTRNVTKKELEEQMKELSETLEKTASEMEQHAKELEEELIQITSETYSESDESPLNIIKTRLVNGEITIDEYNEIKTALNS
jgi:hypothetical protein